MKKINLFCLAFMGFTLSACAEAGGNDRDALVQSRPVLVENKTEIIRINGESPSDFYKHFFFRDTESCERIWYTTTLSDSLLVGKDELGRDVRASVAIMILPSNVFHARYEETSVTKYTSGGYEGVPRSMSLMQGTWAIKKELLVFNDLGHASGLQVNEKKVLRLVIERDFQTPGFAGQVTYVRRMHATHVGIPQLDRCRR